MKSTETKKTAGKTEKTAVEPRKWVSVFVQTTGGQDYLSKLYVKDENNQFKSLADLPLAQWQETEVPGVLTTGLDETSGTLQSISASPFRICCQPIGGTWICKIC